MKAVSSAIALLIASLACSAVFAAEPFRRIALLVASNDGGSDRVPLRYAVSDAQAVASVLSELGGLEPLDRVVVVEPTRAQVAQAMADLRGRVQAARKHADRVEVFLYYSGHSDEEGILTAGQRTSYTELRQGIEAVDADVVVAVIDSCASGAMLRQKGGKLRPPFAVDQANRVRGRAFLTSASANEAAQESDRLGASFFTHHLVSGMRGAADLNADGRVTLNEAYAHAFQHTLQRTSNTIAGPQHPNYDIQLAGSGDVVLTDLASTAATLRMGADVSGRVFVRDAFGHLVVEVDKAPGKPMELGLSPGNYGVTLVSGSSVYAANATVSSGQAAELGVAAFALDPDLEVARVRGDADAETSAADRAALTAQGDAFSFSVVPGLGSTGWGNTDGVVTALSFNLIGGRHRVVRGFEMGLGFNMEKELMSGLQMSGVFNWVDGTVQGVQWTHGLNYGKTVRGAQFGSINVADKVTGLQFGLINVANEVDGEVVGLINAIGNGYHHLETWSSDWSPVMLGGKLGSRHIYTVLFVGYDPREEAKTGHFGVGFGGHIPAGPVYIDVDLLASAVLPDFADFMPGTLSSLRASVGYEFANGVAIFGGPSLNAWVGHEAPSRSLSFVSGTADLSDKDDVDVRLWPGFFVGLRYF
jgi:hypothetical protein